MRRRARHARDPAHPGRSTSATPATSKSHDIDEHFGPAIAERSWTLGELLAIAGGVVRFRQSEHPKFVKSDGWPSVQPLHRGNPMPIDSETENHIIDIKRPMAQLIVRDLDEAVVRALKVRAAKKGVSAEAEHRAILREVLLRRSSRSFKEALLAMPDVGKDTDFAIERDLDRDDGLSA